MKTFTDNSEPVAIILASEPLGDELQTIFGRQDVSSLMIAGTSIIEHIIMELQDLKIHECIILARENASQVQSLIGDTRRWGMNITVMNYSLSVDQVLREYKSLSKPNGLLVIEADRLRSHCIGEFLAQANESEYALLEGFSAAQPLGINLLKPSSADFIINAMPINLKDTVVNIMASTHDFHRANFDVVAGTLPGLEPSVQMNSTVGQRQHWAAKVATRTAKYQESLMIDHHCRVGKNVSLKAVILNHDVYVERNSDLENTIVMPNAIISATQAIKNAVVHENIVFQI